MVNFVVISQQESFGPHTPPPLLPGGKKNNYWSIKSAPITFLYIISALANTYQISKIKIITPLSFCFRNQHTRDREYTFVYVISVETCT